MGIDGKVIRVDGPKGHLLVGVDQTTQDIVTPSPSPRDEVWKLNRTRALAQSEAPLIVFMGFLATLLGIMFGFDVVTS